MRTRRLSHVFGLAVLLGVLIGSAQAKRAPNFDAKDLSGRSQKLAGLRGQVVVLSFWATWCAPCQEELPRLSQISRQYQNKDVRFVAVSIDAPKDRAKIQPFLEKNKIDLNVWVGPDADILQTFGLGEIVPGTVILDQQGEIVARIMGEARDEDVRSRIDWLLGGGTGPAPEAILKRY